MGIQSSYSKLLLLLLFFLQEEEGVITRPACARMGFFSGVGRDDPIGPTMCSRTIAAPVKLAGCNNNNNNKLLLLLSIIIEEKDEEEADLEIHFPGRVRHLLPLSSSSSSRMPFFYFLFWFGW